MSKSGWREWAGPADRPPLVLVHGWLGEAADWTAVAERVAGERRCLAPDLPGHGRTPWRELDVPGVADWLCSELDRRGIERCALAGYSMGGRIALALAVARPGRLSGLALVSASPGIADPAERAARRAADADRAAVLRADPAAFLAAWYRQDLFALNEAFPLDALIARRLAGDVDGLARSLLAWGPGSQEPLWNALPGLRVPLLAVAGARDPRYRTIARRVADRVPQARFAAIEQAGHAVHLEGAEALSRCLAAI